MNIIKLILSEKFYCLLSIYFFSQIFIFVILWFIFKTRKQNLKAKGYKLAAEYSFVAVLIGTILCGVSIWIYSSNLLVAWIFSILFYFLVPICSLSLSIYYRNRKRVEESNISMNIFLISVLIFLASLLVTVSVLR